MSDALDPTRRDLLSSHLDGEAPADAETLMHHSFGAQLHYRNLEAVSRATQQTGAPVPAADDFLNKVMFAIDDLVQEDPCDDFEVLSAWSDGEWDLEPETVTIAAESTRHQIQLLGQALRALPTIEAPGGFAEAVMATIAQTEAPGFESLSALYDKETAFSEVRHLSATELPTAAQDQLRTLKTLSSALRRLPAPTAPAGFARGVLAALPADITDFDTLSAQYDDEANLDLPATPTLIKTFARLSQGFAALPAIEAPAGFAERLHASLDAATFETASARFDAELEGEDADLDFAELQGTLGQVQALSSAFAALPAIEAPPGFAAGVLQAIAADFTAVSAMHDGEATDMESDDGRQAQLRLLEALSSGFTTLAQPQAPAGFAERVMQAIDALPDFETLSAAYDGEDQLQPMRALSRAMAALPQPQAPADFVAKVMLATEQDSKRQLFALPRLLNSRIGQMAAGFAIFGMLVLANQTLMANNPDGTTGQTAAVPVVQVQHTAEEMLFSNPVVETVMDDTMELENSTEEDYNSWIGG